MGSGGIRYFPLRRFHLPLALEELYFAAQRDARRAVDRLTCLVDRFAELLRDPWVAPPDHAEVAGVVANDCLGSAQAASSAYLDLVRLPERGSYRLLLSDSQLGDGTLLGVVDVSNREQVEQVSDGCIAEFRQQMPLDEHALDRCCLGAVGAAKDG